jgi:RNA polymerase sigma-B factor
MPAGAEREQLRAQVIEAWMPRTRRAAARYRHSGEPMEDLTQVAVVGLIQAVDRFDPDRGAAFRHFAAATIAGELKHHFRDRGWSVRVSRRVQELHQEIRQAEPELTQRLGRLPTPADLAEHLNLTEDDVVAGLGVGGAYTARSLNWRARNDDGADEVGDLLGHEDRAIDLVADRESLRLAIRLLPETLKLVLALRFFENLTQTQIARTIGVSQMHVSRLIQRALAILRQQMLAESPRVGSLTR